VHRLLDGGLLHQAGEVLDHGGVHRRLLGVVAGGVVLLR
jgi:hypothetical protein